MEQLTLAIAANDSYAYELRYSSSLRQFLTPYEAPKATIS